MKDNSVYESIDLYFPVNDEKSVKALSFIKAFKNKRRMLITDLVLNCMQKYGITVPEQIDKNTKNYILNEVRYNNSSNEVSSDALLKLFTQLATTATTASVVRNTVIPDNNEKNDSTETIKKDTAVASSENKEEKLPDEPEIIEEIMQEDEDSENDNDNAGNERQSTLDALRMFGCI